MKKVVSGMLIFCALILFAGISTGIESARNYSEYDGVGINVEAVVTKHERHETNDPEDGKEISYVSYVSYSVDGTDYEDITYEEKSARKDLTPVGEVVTIEVNPKDPSEEMDDVLFTAYLFLLASPLVGMFMITAVIKIFMRERLADIVFDNNSEQNIEKYFKKIMKCRVIRTCCFVSAVYPLIINLCFPKVFNCYIWVAVSFVAFAVFLIKDLRRLNLIRNSECKIYEGKFSEKFIKTDSEGDKSYYVRHYYPKLNKIETYTISAKEYKTVSENDKSYVAIITDETGEIYPIMGSYEVNGKSGFFAYKMKQKTQTSL